MKHKTCMMIAETIANNESKCVAHHVGAVIVKDNRIVSTGYNGTAHGLPNCDHVNKSLVDGFQKWFSDECKEKHHEWSITNELHAEENAIQYADIDKRIGSTLYCTHQPCAKCSLMIVNARISKVIFKEVYHRTPPESVQLLKNAGIEVYTMDEYYNLIKL